METSNYFLILQNMKDSVKDCNVKWLAEPCWNCN